MKNSQEKKVRSHESKRGMNQKKRQADENELRRNLESSRLILDYLHDSMLYGKVKNKG